MKHPGRKPGEWAPIKGLPDAMPQRDAKNYWDAHSGPDVLPAAGVEGGTEPEFELAARRGSLRSLALPIKRGDAT